MLDSSRTSSASGVARRPSVSISAQVSRRWDASRLLTATSAPARASAFANDRPSPRLAPVTRAVFPFRSKRSMDAILLASETPGPERGQVSDPMPQCQGNSQNLRSGLAPPRSDRRPGPGSAGSETWPPAGAPGLALEDDL